MKNILYLIACVFSISLWGEDASQFEKMTGLKGTYNESEKVFKVSFPRTDIKISVDNVVLDPFMGLTSWASFTPMDNQFMVMGDLVLLQDEVNPVISDLLENGLEVTALHNHFFYDTPRVFFMHIGGTGSLQLLSEGVKKALDTVKEIRTKNTNLPNGFGNPLPSDKNSITVGNLETIFLSKGQYKEGMAKFIFGRTAQENNITIGNNMGVNTWAAFAGNNENAIVDGDFAVLEKELQQVLKVLRKGNINIVAIHHHMIKENPRMIFLHYWGKGRAEDLAKTIKDALNLTKQSENRIGVNG